MIKGSQKQMIVLRTADSRYFDEAYFVLRKELPRQEGTNGEMLLEADRILREGTGDSHASPQRLRHRLAFFCVGFLLGGIAAALLCLLLL